MRLIDADALEQKTRKIMYGFKAEMEIFLTLVDMQPTIEATPVEKSEWKYFHKHNIAVCKRCSFERNLDDNFGAAISCPNCGANMRGGKYHEK